MKRVIIMIILAVILSVSLSAIQLSKGTDALNEVLLQKSEGKLPIFVVLSEQYDTQQLYNEAKDLPKQERRAYTVNTLKSFSYNTQNKLRALIESLEIDGEIDSVRYIWIYNMIGFNASVEALKILDKHHSIGEIDYDPLRKIMIDDFEYVNDVNNNNENTREITYNVSIVNAPAVWNLGYKGEGVIVAVLDTGVNYNHHDLRNRMWSSPQYPNHGYNFFDNNDNPMDGNGHGTHCAGTVAGDGSAGSQTGMAPESSIMALKVMGNDGSGQTQMLYDGIQFALDNGADVLSMSLGWKQEWSPNRNVARSVMLNALSAGVVAAVAAGNEGNEQNTSPVPNNVRTPGDCPPPWLHPHQFELGGISSVISVGATNSSNQIANFSSRGPVQWADVNPYYDYPYNPEMGLIRPDITAPGVQVKSLRHNSNTGYTTMSGTSMAAPAMAGVLALLLSKDANLTPEQMSQYVEETALSLSTMKSNTFGAGRVDALAAINLVVGENPPHQSSNPNPPNNAENLPLQPRISWKNNAGALMYFVNLGTNNPPNNVLEGYITEDLFFDIPLMLQPETTYYWRIDAMNLYDIRMGAVWSFTTGVLPISVSFNAGSFSDHDWQLTTSGTGSQQWFVTDDSAYSGEYSIRSGSVNHNGSTTVSVTLDVYEAGNISFYHKVSSETNYDYLRFYINSTMSGQWSGITDWQFVSFPVTAGVKTFKWVYIKDQGVSVGYDTAWIDDITFPRLEPTAPPGEEPQNLQYNLGLEAVSLQWDIPSDHSRRNGNRNPIGYNIYRSINSTNNFTKINNTPIEGTSYSTNITNSGSHHFYATAVYDSAESDASESISFNIGAALDAPVFDPPGSEFMQFGTPITVSMSSSSPVNLIYYTLNGANPTANSLFYSEPILIETTTIIKAKAYRIGYLPSQLSQTQYNIVLSADDETIALKNDSYAFPNPFNPETTISFSNKKASNIKIEIFNPKGQLIKTLVDAYFDSGIHQVDWNSIDNNNSRVGSGVYYYRLSADDFNISKKILLMK